MPVTYFVALPFGRNEDGDLVPLAAVECQGEGAAKRRAEVLAKTDGNVGAVAFRRSGEPATGEFDPATVIARFGEVPDDLGEL